MRRTAVVLLATTGLCWAGGPALAAPGDPETGYWARTRTGLPVPVEPPDPVPGGGTWVSADPNGPVALSALRVDLAPGRVAVQLRLTVADEVGTAAVQACPTTDRWAPEQGGRLEAAPAADCTTPLEAVREGDLLVVPLPPGLPGAEVLLRPKPGSAFSITFERATAASVVTAPAPAAVPAAAPPPAFLPPAPVAPPPAFESGVAPALELPPEAAAPLVAAPTLPEPVAAPSPVPAPQAAPVLLAAPVAASPAALTDDRPQSLLALAVLALLGAQAVRLARQPAIAPRALGGSARRSGPTPVVTTEQVASRGVGRFRTERARPPVRI